MSLRKGKKSRDDAGISTSNILNKRRNKKSVSFDGEREAIFDEGKTILDQEASDLKESDKSKTRKIASDFFQIPKNNLITSQEWKKSLISSGFKIKSCENITSKTFSPYYKNFFQNYSQKKGLPDFTGTALNSMFQSIQPFCYNIAVCKKVLNLL
jgi:hypothetical protein